MCLFSNQNDNFHGLTGSGTLVYYPLQIHSVLLKNNLQKHSSLDYCHTFSPSTAARGRSDFSHKDHDSPSDRSYPHSPSPTTTTGVGHTIPHFLQQQSPFSLAHFYLQGPKASAKPHSLSQSITKKRKTLTTVTGARATQISCYHQTILEPKDPINKYLHPNAFSALLAGKLARALRPGSLGFVFPLWVGLLFFGFWVFFKVLCLLFDFFH